MSEIKPVELKTNTDLNHYVQELNEDVRLTVSNLREKSLMVSSIRSKWLNYYHVEKENLDRIKKVKDKILKSKLSNTNVHDSVLKMKSEDKLAQNDENIQKLNKMAENTKGNISYIEQAMNILVDFGWNIKNTIEILKLEH